MASVYVHFPYCLAKCPYCDFVSYKADRAEIAHAKYADAILRELEARAEPLDARASRFVVSSIFFGGGTPSLWEPSELARVITGIRARLTTSDDLEITAECNPTSLDAGRARELAGAGINRLSIGVQSLDPDQLRFLGRWHDPDGARRAIEGALASGVPRVSADLIFGLPEQRPDHALEQANELVSLGLRHLSCYQLTIEPGTQFGERRRRGLLPVADDGVVAEAFSTLHVGLEGRGLGHYEISNYAAPGEEARHNLAYWRGDEYLGLGCGAVGFLRTGDGGVRYRNPIDPQRYIDSTSRRAGALRLAPVDAEIEALGPDALLRERIMLGLRVAEGVDLDAAGDDLGIDPWTAARVHTIAELVSRARLILDGGRLRIPPAAWLFTDDTTARLF